MHSIFPILAITSLFGVPAARADTIWFQSEIHTGNNLMAFYNHTNSEQDIVQIEVELGPGAFFDPVDMSWALASTSPSQTIAVAHYVPVWSATSTSTDVGLVGTLAAAFSGDGKKATFNFTDFNPGETWGVFVDLDPLGGTGDAAGAAMSGLKVSVVYAGGVTLTSSCSDPYFTAGVDECHSATFNGNKKSFPSANSAVVAGVPGPGDLEPVVPEPVTGVLTGSALIVGVLISKRRSRASAHSNALSRH